MAGEEPTEALRKELVAWVRKEIGPIASPDLIQFSPGLPKTRSGKIMRRILRKIAEDEYGALGDTSTLADPGVVTELIDNRQNRGKRLRFLRDRREFLHALDPGGENHRLGPALDAELGQDRRELRLHGRLGNAEFIGDLLVEQPLRQHHQDPHLLRRQRRQPRTQRAGLLVGGAEGESRSGGVHWPPSSTTRIAARIDSRSSDFGK